MQETGRPTQRIAMSNNPIYALQERFLSFQGEGVYAGQAAYFLRLYGCDQKCHFCDSAGTWHKDWKPDYITRYTAADLVALIPTDARFAYTVITGGEPAMYNLEPLITAIINHTNRPVHIETAGHRSIGNVDAWITLSPKPFATAPLIENVAKANEFKIIVENEASIIDGLAVIQARQPDAPVWLHPEWSKRNDETVKQLIVNYVKTHGEPFRAGYQIHKMYKADLYDQHADKRLIPLGGNIKNGY